MTEVIPASTRLVLARWIQLQSADGLKHARRLEIVLVVMGCVFLIVAVFGVVYGFHPGIIAGAALIAGWLIAERNALRNRIAQWPALSAYLDWTRIRKDSGPAV